MTWLLWIRMIVGVVGVTLLLAFLLFPEFHVFCSDISARTWRDLGYDHAFEVPTQHRCPKKTMQDFYDSRSRDVRVSYRKTLQEFDHKVGCPTFDGGHALLPKHLEWRNGMIQMKQKVV